MEELTKAMEILEKLSFFGGQRAGRELWNDKPRVVQDEDIAAFNRDVQWLRDFIRKHMSDGKRTDTFEFDFSGVKSFDCQCGRHYVNTEGDAWIPVDERLPEEPKENPVFEDKPLELYLVDMGGSYPLRAFWNGKRFTDGWSTLKVIAWHPLPETYQAERSGK